MEQFEKAELSTEDFSKFMDIIDAQIKLLKKKQKMKPHHLSKLLPEEIFAKVKCDDMSNSAPYELDVIEADYEEQEASTDDILQDESIQKDAVIKEETDSNKTVNESTIPEILDWDKDFVDISLQEDPNKYLVRPARSDAPVNWAHKFITSQKKDRIVWPSTFYSLRSSYEDKTPFEKAEERMDLAADEFSKWLTTLSEDQCVKMDKNLIKELFDIKVKGGAAKALHVEPRQLKTIPESIAAQLNLTEWALERKVEELAQEELKKKPKEVKMVAFGKLLPLSLRVPKSVIDDAAPLKSDFPEKLRTMEEVFQGLTTLKATKYIVKELMANPDVPKPEFVLKCKDFQQ